MFRKFKLFQFRLVFRYGILYKSMDWFIYDRSLRHERGNHTKQHMLQNQKRRKRIISYDVSIFMSVSTNGWKSHILL